MIKNLTRLSVLLCFSLLACSVAANALQFGHNGGRGFRHNPDPNPNPTPNPNPNPGVADPGPQAAVRNNTVGTPVGQSVFVQGDQSGYPAFFVDGLARFQEVETPDANGLGPRFNSNSCSSCHAFPTPGGSSAPMNPQFAMFGSPIAPTSVAPSFITADGPTREARFVFFHNPNGSLNTSAPNGGVETLFTVTGSAGAGSCQLTQPSFAANQAQNNVIFRIPTPTYGLGLIENLDDSVLLKNAQQESNNNLGITPALNHSGNDGTITRFGWKAQNKSLLIFSGEAYNVEMGVSNILFTQNRPLPGEENATGLPANCLNLKLNANGTPAGNPEDAMNPTATTPAAAFDDAAAFATFMRFLAAPAPGGVTLNGHAMAVSSMSNGSSLFNSIGCAVCHTPSLSSTGPSTFSPTLANQTVNAFSDIALHHMGVGLADNVSQGGAGGDQFRTAPLWGVGQRVFFLHDGRTSDLLTAIRDHASSGSEANQVIQNFNNLTNAQQQDLVNFLRSL